ncbi:UDP-3-O-(3-hydroxymyristoyl)glucosamine N-acyltransferase [Clostridium folliculivorans]|uniref:UDP-3-O-(3-hydroxymyristoyl)glucosamine N-acyltransferase n=1 Tax=Clostridium folliculivorans TaxID=2886038 RepID=A0A9W5Y3D1_9CLOT|nr:UDP-3-O-(3-hydroxymyristoyl)glucosamine N-acyltransferase [Clostridium folliculivorans]GKU25989.1 hypothetical protein CFOLD11_28160 [Clostridium folliculivorans]GKU28075.1 hypothetical protein CFB3_01810 [Clostridium folliculivorans]
MDKKFFFNSYDLVDIDDCYGNITKSIDIYNISTAGRPRDNSLIFISKIDKLSLLNMRLVNESIILISNAVKLFLDENEISIHENNIVLIVENARLEYAKILTYILKRQSKVLHGYKLNDEGYVIGENVKVGQETQIEPLVFIGNNCSIGERCIIRSGAKIRDNVIVGNDCIIKENSVIGDEGFGMERDEKGVPFRIPHLGGVILGNNVEVGALVSVAQGTIEPTIIEDGVKIDDCVFIAHNCRVGKGSYIIANAEISGSVAIGENSWIGPNTSIINGVKIGSHVTIGIGSVVLRNVQDNEVVAGNPADTIENLKMMKRIKQKLLNEMNI